MDSLLAEPRATVGAAGGGGVARDAGVAPAALPAKRVAAPGAAVTGPAAASPSKKPRLAAATAAPVAPAAGAAAGGTDAGSEGAGVADEEEEEEDEDEEFGAGSSDGGGGRARPAPVAVKRLVSAPLAAGGGKPKPGGAVVVAASYTRLRYAAVRGAEYRDDVIGWGVMRDGSEVLLAKECWRVPTAGAGEPELMGDNVEGAFAFVPGFDAVAWSAGQDYGRERAAVGSIVLDSVPVAAAPLAALPLPGFDAAVDGGVRRVSAAAARDARGGALVLFATKVRLFLVRVTAAGAAAAGGGGASPPVLTVEATVDMRVGALGRALAQPARKGSNDGYDRGLVSAARLWVDTAGTPRAVLGAHGDVVVAPLDAAAAAAGPLRAIGAHESRRVTREAYTGALELWLSGPLGATAVTTGNDGELALSVLEGAPVKASPIFCRRACLDAKGRCGYLVLAVADGPGVAFTGAQGETRGVLHDLRATGGRFAPLARTGRFAGGDARKLTIMCASFSLSGVLAYTNSNNADDPVVTIVRPVGKAAGGGAGRARAASGGGGKGKGRGKLAAARVDDD